MSLHADARDTCSLGPNYFKIYILMLMMLALSARLFHNLPPDARDARCRFLSW